MFPNSVMNPRPFPNTVQEKPIKPSKKSQKKVPVKPSKKHQEKVSELEYLIWPEGRIPYVISKSFDENERTTIRDNMKACFLKMLRKDRNFIIKNN
jgi:hypothetical protein